MAPQRRTEDPDSGRGERFNPYGLHAVRVPLGLVSYRGLSWGAKVLYGRMALHLGRPDSRKARFPVCNPGEKRLAVEMGVSEDVVERWLAELVQEKFMERRRRRRMNAEWVFLPHPCLEPTTLRDQHVSQEPATPPSQDAPQEPATLPVRTRKPGVLDTAKSSENSPEPLDSASGYATENVQYENVQIENPSKPPLGGNSPGSTAPRPSQPNYTTDELYVELIETATGWGAAVITEDAINAFPRWCRLSGQQRAQAVATLKARVEAGDDPAYFRLAKFVDPRAGEYRRPVVVPRQKSGGRKIQGLAEMMETGKVRSLAEVMKTT